VYFAASVINPVGDESVDHVGLMLAVPYLRLRHRLLI
jgi:hypothetical protein